MFTLLLASELNGGNCNFEVTFPAYPSLDEVRDQAAAVFEEESRRLGLPLSFADPALQIFLDTALGEGVWIDLHSASQLRPNCQLFVLPAAPAAAREPSLPPPHPPAADLHARSYSSSVHALRDARLAANSPPPAAFADHRIVTVADTSRASEARVVHRELSPHSHSVGMPFPFQSAVVPGVVDGGRQTVLTLHGTGEEAEDRAFMRSICSGPHRLLDAGTYRDKVAALWVVTDRDGGGLVGTGDILRTLHMLGLSKVFSRATMADLASRATAHAPRAHFAQFEAFGERYPTLVDSCYQRLCALVDEVERDLNLEAERNLLSNLAEVARDDRDAFLACERETEAARSRVAQCEYRLSQCVEELRAIREAGTQSEQDVARAAGERDVRVGELANQQDRENHAAALCAEAAHLLADRLDTYQLLDASLASREAEMLRVMAECEDVKRDGEAYAILAAQALNDAREAHCWEQDAQRSAVEGALEIQMAADRLRDADHEYIITQSREVELEEDVKRIAPETMAHRDLRNVELTLLRDLAAAEEDYKNAWWACRCETDAIKDVVEALQLAHERFNLKRAAVEQQEIPLIHEEIEYVAAHGLDYPRIIDLEPPITAPAFVDPPFVNRPRLVDLHNPIDHPHLVDHHHLINHHHPVDHHLNEHHHPVDHHLIEHHHPVDHHMIEHHHPVDQHHLIDLHHPVDHPHLVDHHHLVNHHHPVDHHHLIDHPRIHPPRPMRPITVAPSPAPTYSPSPDGQQYVATTTVVKHHPAALPDFSSTDPHAAALAYTAAPQARYVY
ncbi:hypothetical protein DIPPA_06080 [Diplonema papillatum]|nr:hypothetical protein DIPPA_06080 [Diplonema papillatum]